MIKSQYEVERSLHFVMESSLSRLKTAEDAYQEEAKDAELEMGHEDHEELEKQSKEKPSFEKRCKWRCAVNETLF